MDKIKRKQTDRSDKSYNKKIKLDQYISQIKVEMQKKEKM